MNFPPFFYLYEVSKNNKTTKKKGKKVTPLMQQYFQVKTKHPDAIMLFRVGDFYETFAEDAITASQVLGIVLTKRNNGGTDIELAGFPYHSLDTYLPKLVRAGYRVAICEQLEKPSKERKIVRRGVTEIVTPGIAISDKLLDHKTNNFLAAVSFGKKELHGLAFLDISTGEFLVSEGNQQYIDKLLQGFKPTEIIYSKTSAKQFNQSFGDQFYTYTLDDWVFTSDFAVEKLLTHFEVKSLKGYGVEELDQAQIAAGAILHYLATTENTNLKHINAVNRIEPDRYVWLDRFTVRNLELVYSQHESGVSLIDILDKTVSPMGGRLLKKWMVLPLKSKPAIDARLEMVEYFIREHELAKEIDNNIHQIGDLERLISKVPLQKVNPREVVQLKRALSAITPIKELLTKSKNTSLAKIAKGLDPCDKIRTQIEKQILEDPPVNLNKGGVIADGVSEELDEYRSITKNAKDLLLEIQQTEAERTGIASLKIGFNNVFGYYLEVTNKYKGQGLVPDEWVRKQTLTNAERYITDELKKLEVKILGAEEKIQALEVQLFESLVSDMADYIEPIQRNARLIAQLDCLQSFAKCAVKNNYALPVIDKGFEIDIKEGRHPVIEHQLELGESYIPNDVFLDKDNQQILMITGPNMAGKSTFLRQNALIALMAQMGSYVPAAQAHIGMISQLFSRVGASDDLARGRSTFMVEMIETAAILNQASPRNFVILDEIGRGTATFDGLSIAWAAAEHLHAVNSCRTLFATHYHELTDLVERLEHGSNASLRAKEWDGDLVFLHDVQGGAADKSYGIQVAKLAGLPPAAVERARSVLERLESEQTGAATDLNALPLFTAPAPAPRAKPSEIDAAITAMDVDSLSPREALDVLYDLKAKAERKS